VVDGILDFTSSWLILERFHQWTDAWTSVKVIQQLPQRLAILNVNLIK
jgi:hypothetical protein